MTLGTASVVERRVREWGGGGVRIKSCFAWFWRWKNMRTRQIESFKRWDRQRKTHFWKKTTKKTRLDGGRKREEEDEWEWNQSKFPCLFFFFLHSSLHATPESCLLIHSFPSGEDLFVFWWRDLAWIKSWVPVQRSAGNLSGGITPADGKDKTSSPCWTAELHKTH